MRASKGARGEDLAPPVFPSERRVGNRIVAYDGADSDGGTLYVLYDGESRIVAAAAWPQPLEEFAEVWAELLARRP